MGVIVMGVKMIGRSSPPRLEDARGSACTEVQKHLAAFIAGNLDAQLSADIEAHLKMCSNCQAALAKLQASHAGAMRQAPLSRAKLLAVSGNSKLLLAQH
jgi:anti-sigma factor RsiW